MTKDFVIVMRQHPRDRALREIAPSSRAPLRALDELSTQIEALRARLLAPTGAGASNEDVDELVKSAQRVATAWASRIPTP